MKRDNSAVVASWIYLIGVTLIVIIACGALYQCHSEEEQACERRGGYYHCAYKSECICIDRSMLR